MNCYDYESITSRIAKSQGQSTELGKRSYKMREWNAYKSNKDPERMMLGVLVVLIQAGGYPAALLKFVVHTQQNILDIGLGVEDRVAAIHEAGKARGSFKAHKIVFDEHGPVRHEHPLNTTAGCPAGATVAGNFANLLTKAV